MKKIFILVLLCAMAITLKAQNTFPSSGNVGIGTTSPTGQLSLTNQIANTTNSGDPINYTATGVIEGQSVFNSYYVANSDGYGSFPRYLDIAAVGAPSGTTGGGNIRFITNPVTLNSPAVERMRISSSGNVGIGTTTPNASLDVNGGIFSGGNNLDGVDIGYLSNSGKMLLGWNRSQGGGETDFFSNQGGGSTGGFAYYNYSNTGTQSLLMYVRGSGQVSIGDCNPYSYKLAVGGSMIAESVTVKLLASWPDYVFKPTYNLTPLSEVKTYIDQNHHLPEMPSEKEVSDKGLDLGEMNKLLTKKVEELTLYLIDMQKEINQMKKEIANNKTPQNK